VTKIPSLKPAEKGGKKNNREREGGRKNGWLGDDQPNPSQSQSLRVVFDPNKSRSQMGWKKDEARARGHSTQQSRPAKLLLLLLLVLLPHAPPSSSSSSLSLSPASASPPPNSNRDPAAICSRARNRLTHPRLTFFSWVVAELRRARPAWLLSSVRLRRLESTNPPLGSRGCRKASCRNLAELSVRSFGLWIPGGRGFFFKFQVFGRSRSRQPPGGSAAFPF
jgi:hypothetical protein